MSVGTLLWHMGPVFCCRCYCGDFFAKRLQEISPILTIGFLSFVCWFFALHFFFFLPNLYKYGALLWPLVQGFQ